MADVDLLIRGCEPGDVAVDDGRIVATGTELGLAAAETIDATGLRILPGAVDAHVHFDDPGRADWEGWASGTAAAAAGGTTCVVDMPLNAHPPTVDGDAFRRKVEAADGAAVTDFALWGGLVPGNVAQLAELAELGVVGFKAFMCPSGIDDFDAVDDDTLGEGMAEAARLGLPVAVHAESPALLGAPTRTHLARLPRLAPGGGRAGRDRARDRPRARAPAARSTSCTSPPAAASARHGRRAPAASTSPARRARTTSCWTRTTSSGSARSRSARRRCAHAPTATTSAPSSPPATSTSSPATTPPRRRR